MSRPSLALLVPFSIALGAMQGAEPGPSNLDAPAAARAVTPETAAKLAASLPKIAVTAPDSQKPAAQRPDLRETDKPANGIVRLPKYVVREPKPPVFREQDLYSQGDFARRLAKRYYSEGYLAFNRLVRYTPLALYLPSAEATALAQYEEEERLRNKAEFTEYANMLLRSNPAAGTKFKGDVQAFFMHWSDMGWSSGPK